MLDAQGRITIRKELVSKANFKPNQKLELFFDHIQKRMLLLQSGDSHITDMYFITTVSIDEKCRVFIPKYIRDIFPKASYLSAERNGEIYILIIEH